MMALWACSILATRKVVRGFAVDRDTSHAVVVVEAGSRDEAVGRGLRVALKAYPPGEGWYGHDVAAEPGDAAIDPDDEITCTRGPKIRVT